MTDGNLETEKAGEADSSSARCLLLFFYMALVFYVFLGFCSGSETF